MPQNAPTPNNTYCCIESCGSKACRETHLSFHNFPKFGKYVLTVTGKNGRPETMDLRMAWLKATQNENNTKPHMRVCSKHFHEHDFYSSALSPLAKRRKLRTNAVPSLHLDSEFADEWNKGHIIPKTAIPKLLINASDAKNAFTRRIRKKRSLLNKEEPTVSRKHKKQKLIFEKPIKREREESQYEVERIPHFTFVDINSEFSNEFIISDDEEETNEVEELDDIQWEGPLTLNRKGSQLPRNSNLNSRVKREEMEDIYSEGPLTKTKKLNQPQLNSALTTKAKIEESKKPEYIDFNVFSDLVVKIKNPQMDNTEDEFEIKGKDYAEKLRLMTPKQRSLVEKLVAEIISQATMNRLKSHVLNLILGK